MFQTVLYTYYILKILHRKQNIIQSTSKYFKSDISNLIPIKNRKILNIDYKYVVN